MNANTPTKLTQIEVITKQYVLSHGKNPSGRGWWMFEVAGETFEVVDATFAEARKAAQRRAVERGVWTVTVLP